MARSAPCGRRHRPPRWGGIPFRSRLSTKTTFPGSWRSDRRWETFLRKGSSLPGPRSFPGMSDACRRPHAGRSGHRRRWASGGRGRGNRQGRRPPVPLPCGRCGRGASNRRPGDRGAICRRTGRRPGESVAAWAPGRQRSLPPPGRGWGTAGSVQARGVRRGAGEAHRVGRRGRKPIGWTSMLPVEDACKRDNCRSTFPSSFFSGRGRCPETPGRHGQPVRVRMVPGPVARRAGARSPAILPEAGMHPCDRGAPQKTYRPPALFEKGLRHPCRCRKTRQRQRFAGGARASAPFRASGRAFGANRRSAAFRQAFRTLQASWQWRDS
jgi:hypothetical protein